MPTFEKLRQEMYIIEHPVNHQGIMKLHMMMTTLLPLKGSHFYCQSQSYGNRVSYFWQKNLLSQAPAEQGVKFIE